MDIFKLLARSTNLQKSSSGYGTASYQQIPSAGNFGVNIDERELSLSNGFKRKRPEHSKEEGPDLPPKLDFFKSETEELKSSLNSRDSIAHAPEKRSGENHKHNEGEVIEAPRLDAEDSKRLLKQHKLKITLLNIDINIDSHERPAKRRKDDSYVQPPNSKKDMNTQLVLQPLTSFRELSSKYRISKRLAANLSSQGYSKPTEVQMGSLPILLGSDDDRGLSPRKANRMNSQRSEIDLITVAPTGSGKTLAFLINTVHGLLEDHRTKGSTLNSNREPKVEALIVVPTHELADQIVNEGRKLAAGTKIKISRMRKGMVLNPDLQTTQENSDEKSNKNADEDSSGETPKLRARFLVKTAILVSTPLMLLHSMSESSKTAPILLPEVRYLILDEADILLDPLFRTQTLGIWSACTNPTLQTSLWSATMGSSIESIAKYFILDRRRKLGIPFSKDSGHHVVRLVVGLKDSAVPNISHRLIYAASEQGKLLALRQLLHPHTASTSDSLSIQPPFLIFTQTIPRAIALHSELLYDISPEAGGSSRIAVLHADLSDTARSAIMTGFRKGEIWVLITTDLLSRGVDFRGINGVVNYDIPSTSASYVHRVGRTGRQGREGGVAVTFYTKEDIPFVKNIANIIAMSERANETDGRSADRPKIQQWLLDALPAVSKKAKQELKLKGVESRRAVGSGGAGARQAKKVRISTKSGYERKMENKRKGAVAGSRRRAAAAAAAAAAAIYDEELDGRSEEEWEGIDEG